MFRLPRTFQLPLALFSLSVAATFGAIGHVQAAAPPQVITLTPTSVDQSVVPGTTYSGTFQVINQGQTTYNFNVYGAPYHVTGEDYEPGFSYTPGSPQVSDWFSFGVTTATIAPGKSATIPYTIKVPLGTAPGGYYAAAFAETKVPTATKGVTLNERVGEIFYLSVPGPVKQEGHVVSWDSNWFQDVPLKATLRLQNSGGLHFAATTKIQVKDIFGSPKYTLNTTKYLLPQTIRVIDITWDKSPPFGLFKVDGEVTILGKTTSLPSHYVLVMSKPVRIGLLVLLILLTIISFIRGVIRKRRQKYRKIRRI